MYLFEKKKENMYEIINIKIIFSNNIVFIAIISYLRNSLIGKGFIYF